MKPEIYVSTDVETDGPIPGVYSMLSIGSAAFDIEGKLLDTFYANLETLPEAKSHPDTMKWWKSRLDAWENCRKDLQKPEDAMRNYTAWLLSLPGAPVFVGYPASFDFMFVYWYLIRFTGQSPFSFSALDIKSYAAAVLKKPFKDTVKRNMPKEWFDAANPHTHNALDDAIEQGKLFCNILTTNGVVLQ